MPSYERHWALAMWAGAAILLVTYRLNYLSTDVLVFAGGTLFAARYISPDIDMKNTTPYKNWGVFRHMLIPYAWMFSLRGMSHHPIWGPLTLIPYTFTCFAVIAAVSIVFVLPVVNDGANYLCNVVTCIQAGTVPPGFLWMLGIVIAATVFSIEVHDIYDAIGKGDRQA